MKPSLLGWGLLAVGLGATVGCNVTMAELKALNPAAVTLEVHCHPWQIPEGVKLFAVRSSSDHIVTDETQDELRDYAEHASVFFEVNASAPRENALTMKSEYGLVCSEHLAMRSTPLESLRDKEPCSMQANAMRTPELVGDTNSQPCNPGAGNPANAEAGSVSAALPRIGVCARPEGIKSDEWHGGPGITAGVKTQDEYDAQVAKATVIFFIDKSAPPESVWHFGPNVKARCPGKPPIPYKDWVAKNQGTSTQQSGSTNAGTGTKPATGTSAGTGTSPATASTTATTPKSGSGAPSATSSPTGQGKALSIFEQIANNMIVAGALAQGNTSGSLNQSGGHRNGMPGGQNIGGFSFPLLQAGVATFQVISAVGLKPKDFIDIVNAASKKGQRTIIEKADKAALDMADDLIKNHGQYQMAQGLEEVQTIMPYEMASKFTKDLGNKFQAHKIFERQALKRSKDSDAGFEKLPSVILTKEEHKEITDALAQAWTKYGPKNKSDPVTVDQLRKIYNAAYKSKYPHWLEIIEKQLRQI